ncbi:TetR/AcrR family transcriptional regulator C-terminal domain-containing protein [uncultured Ruthenibacterium sp.]|uniref:TetR/AcrR family transcriptional regulator C-terminal domain-containing protein n=1 Tax=uncultured Ruthenibacterium sp. TaxID=1905347 RepID=UPI00349ED1A2
MPFDMKEMISDQLNVLLKQKGLDKITVKELVDACHISRQTFYYHFRDIMDVVEWQQKQVLEQSICQSLKESSPQAAIRRMIRESASNRELLTRLLKSRRRMEIERLLVRTVRDYLEEMLRKRKSDKALSASDAQAALCFYSSGIVGLMLSDLENKEQDVDVRAQQIYRLLAGELTLG